MSVTVVIDPSVAHDKAPAILERVRAMGHPKTPFGPSSPCTSADHPARILP
jgi:hypothetical protein